MSNIPTAPTEATSLTSETRLKFDVIVVGSGNAGSSAALSAIDNGCKHLLIIDKCPPEWVGGNSYFTAGAYRTVHHGLADILSVVPNVDPELAATMPYTHEQFAEDIMRLSDGRLDPALVNALVGGSHDTVSWLSNRVKIPLILSFHRQAYLVSGRQKFWGGMVLAVEGGGKGGRGLWLPTTELLRSLESRSGLTRRRLIWCCPTVGSPDSRSRNVVRSGETLLMAQRAGAMLQGDWGGCHSTCWDANTSTDIGDRVLSNQFTKSGYPLGIMVNADGERFVDEEEDFRNYTYAKFGREILKQKGGMRSRFTTPR